MALSTFSQPQSELVPEEDLRRLVMVPVARIGTCMSQCAAWAGLSEEALARHIRAIRNPNGVATDPEIKALEAQQCLQAMQPYLEVLRVAGQRDLPAALQGGAVPEPEEYKPMFLALGMAFHIYLLTADGSV